MVDRNLQVSYLIVDEMHHEHPELIKDQYWDEVFPNELPYTIASERFREEHPEPSTAKIEVSKSNAMPTVMSSVRIDDMVGNPTESKSGTPTVQAVNYKFPDSAPDEEVRIKYDGDAHPLHRPLNVHTKNSNQNSCILCIIYPCIHMYKQNHTCLLYLTVFPLV